MAAVVRFVFARGIVGMTEASTTQQAFHPENPTVGVDDLADRAGAGGMEVARGRLAEEALGVVVAGAYLGCEERRERSGRGERTRELEGLEHRR